MHVENHTDKENCCKGHNHISSFIVALGCILLSAVIIYCFYLPERPKPIDYDTVLERRKTLKKVMATQYMALDTYAWLEKDNGIVIIPVSKAMELVVEEINDPEKRKIREQILATTPQSKHSQEGNPLPPK